MLKLLRTWGTGRRFCRAGCSCPVDSRRSPRRHVAGWGHRWPCEPVSDELASPGDSVEDQSTRRHHHRLRRHCYCYCR